ncbi:MAG: ABC transporter ATP-binding protein [Myxococcales bacterium]
MLQIDALTTCFDSPHGRFAAVDGVSLSIREGGSVALVGESGCGKTALALSILRLLGPRAAITSGRVLFRGTDLVTADEPSLRRIRGAGIGMVFQEPASALNPVLTAGEQVAEAIRAHARVSRRDAADRAVALLRALRLPAPERVAAAHPHQLSGGMKQRVGLAIALASEPALLIADEPTTALDATVQAQLLGLIDDERRRRRMGLLLVTHDLRIVEGLCDELAVMYAGRIVEHGPASVVLGSPRHPYTAALLEAGPRGAHKSPLATIPGTVPPPHALPSGCTFRTRCPFATPRCAAEPPGLVAGVACHHPLTPAERLHG